MIPSLFTHFVQVLICGVILTTPALSGGNLAKGAKVHASSESEKYAAAYVVDGNIADNSRWLAATDDRKPWIELDFGKEIKIAVADIYSGWNGGESAMVEFDLEIWNGRAWISEPTWKVKGSKNIVRRIEVGRNASKLRVRPGRKNLVGKVYEIAVYDDANTTMGTDLKWEVLPTLRDRHIVALNQIGFQTNRPKRFTAPLSADETAFTVRSSDDSKLLFKGEIKNHIGDFSKFNPTDSSTEYVIELRDDTLKSGISDPFIIQQKLWKNQFWQPAVDFLIDSRSVVGTHPSAYGGCPWRDGTYYDAIIPSLVMFYMADPARIDAMPRQIDWQADKKRVLSQDFKFDAKNANPKGVMEAVRAYYTELDPPKSDAPDVVKLIHWGAGYYCMKPSSRDPSGDPLGERVSSQTIEQVSYVLWAWPTLKKWLPQSFHDRCRDLCFNYWKSMGAFDIPELWDMKTYHTEAGGKKKNPMGGSLHPYKGRHAPGHSIVPNLIMYEVAKREHRVDAPHYLNAAVKQTKWVVDNLDWNDPRSTKGHRMSEHRTITNLVWILQKYPNHAPAGLKQKIVEWAQVAVKRSNNMWDFRRYDLDEHWTIPKLNDVGNWVGAPSVLLAASWVVDDPALRARLEQIALAQADAVFGRNPRLAAAPSHPKNGFSGIERGWPKSYYDNVTARLELCRGSISSGPGTQMFPFNPKGSYRHSEGWVNYGASWCMSLAYMAYDEKARTTPNP